MAWRGTGDHLRLPVKKNDGHYVIRFQAVDYAAQVWLNGVKAGEHDGGEFSFEVDVTRQLNYSGSNLLVVRVLNPDYTLYRWYHFEGNAFQSETSSLYQQRCVQFRGITGDVELLSVGTVRVQDVFVTTDWKSGRVTIKTWISSELAATKSNIAFKIGEARSGRALVVKTKQQQLNPGLNIIETSLQVEGA